MKIKYQNRMKNSTVPLYTFNILHNYRFQNFNYPSTPDFPSTCTKTILPSLSWPTTDRADNILINCSILPKIKENYMLENILLHINS